MDVGIIAAEIYFPKSFINQKIIENVDGVPGKYTKGLGQISMSICDDAEDVNSLALTVTHRLIERVGINLKQVGFLEVGSESLVDKSKSTKSHLMSLFEQSGNFDVVGADVKSACYGGTAACFNAINWLESSCCNDRLALVVATDIAVYATTATQPTGGAGAVAILLGPNAPLVFDRGLRVCAMRHRYDFYKPIMGSIFPQVDGALSVACYKEALLNCYDLYCTKVEKITGHRPNVTWDLNPKRGKGFPIDFACFHSPFCRLVAKSFGWLALQDVIDYVPKSPADSTGFVDEKHNCDLSSDTINAVHQLTPLIGKAGSAGVSREVDAVCLEATRTLFLSKVEPGLRIASQVGNMYTASLFSCLISLACSLSESELRGRRVLLFSYGSGYTASMFSLRFSDTADLRAVFGQGTDDSPFHRLAQRTPLNHSQFLQAIQNREYQVDKAPLQMPSDNLEERFFPGTYYLTRVDEKHRRFYERTMTTQ